MDILTFLASLVASVAWPTAVCLVVYWVLPELRSLVPRIRRLKYKDAEAEFEAGIERLGAEVAADSSLPKLPAPPPPEVDVLNQLADIEPRAAIGEAYRRIEFAAARAVQRLGLAEDSSLRSPFRHISILSQHHLDSKKVRQIEELRSLRNEAVHLDDFSLRGKPIHAYVAIAQALEAYLDSLGT